MVSKLSVLLPEAKREFFEGRFRSEQGAFADHNYLFNRALI